MITYQQERLYDVVGEIDELLALHYQELCLHKDRIALAPCWDRYAAMEREGALLVYTARLDGDLIAYSAFFSSPHPHYAGLRLVSNDVLFLKAEHRTGRTGIRLIQFCEEKVKALYGTDFALTWHAKENTPLADILKRMKYRVQDIVLSKLF